MQRAAIDRATAFWPGYDHLVADVIEHFSAIIHDGNGKQTERVIEKTVDGDPAKALGEACRSCDIDE